MSDVKKIISSDTKREDRIPPGQSETDKLPLLNEGSAPVIKPGEWTLKIHGLVENEKILSFEEFISLPQVEVTADIHCVESWSRLGTIWEGVPSSALKDVVRIRVNAKYVIIHAHGGYSANLPIGEFFDEDVVFALKYDHEPLPTEHGGPVRLVVPKRYFWKSPKWVSEIEFLEEDKPGYWEQRGYHNHGDPWAEERFSQGK